jgi:uncharacterized membrane protein
MITARKGPPADRIQHRVFEALKALTGYIAGGIEAVAALIIGIASIEATLRACPLFIRWSPSIQQEVEPIRLRLGRWLTLALEFEVAADILRTAVAPSWNDIGQLAAIVALRTILNYFLRKEVATAELQDMPQRR